MTVESYQIIHVEVVSNNVSMIVHVAKHFSNVSHCTWSGSSCQTHEIPFQFPGRQSMEQIALSSYYCLLYEPSGMESWCENTMSDASYQSEYRVYHIRYGHTLGTKSCHDANFVVTFGAAGGHYDSLWCNQWWQGLHHDDSQFLVLFCYALFWSILWCVFSRFILFLWL